MTNYIDYTPSGAIARALFNFDAFGISNVIYDTGMVAISVSDAFTYRQYLYSYPGLDSDVYTSLSSGAGGWTSTQFSNINLIAGSFSAFANINFSSVVDYSGFDPAQVGANSDINISLISRPWLDFSGESSIGLDLFGYGYSRGDVIINVDGLGPYGTRNDYSFDSSSYSYHVLMHEIGHSLGLSHPHFNWNSGGASVQLTDEFNALSQLRLGFENLGFKINSGSDLDKEYFTIMSYDDQGSSGNANSFAQTPMILDVIALQEAYGEGLGTLGLDNDIIKPGSTSGVAAYRTYFDKGGVDTVDASNYAEGAYVHLGTSISGATHLVGVTMSSSDAALMLSGGSPQSLRWLYGEYENAIGSSGGDMLYGNEYANNLSAGLGDDTVFGGFDNDVIDGGGGTDTVIFLGDRIDYLIAIDSTGLVTVSDQIDHRDGMDSLLGVEFLSFADGIVSVGADTTAPTVVSWSPADGETGVQVAANIVVTFNEAIQRGVGSIVLKDAANQVVETFDAASSNHLSISGATLTLNPTADLAGSTHYFLSFASGTIQDTAGNSYAGTTTYDFTTVAVSLTPIVWVGTSAADTFNGSAAADTITGKAGVDKLDGKGGGDLYIMASVTDHAAAEVTDTGSSGTDELRFTSTTASTLNLYAGDTGLELVTIGTGTGTSAVTTGTKALNINAAAVLNPLTLQGNDGINTLTGTAYADTIDGGGGNDVIYGGAGNDTLTGGLGVDTFTVASGLDTLTDLGQGGADVLIVAAGATAYATLHTAWTATAASVNSGTEFITTHGQAVNLAAVSTGNGFNVTNDGGATTLTGSGLDDALTGGEGADSLNGGAGHDHLWGAGGQDILTGGLGTDAMDGGNDADLYIVAAILEHAAAEVTDTGGSGEDELRFAATTASTLVLYAGDSGLERVTIGTGTGASAVTTGTTALSINAAAVLNALTLQGNDGINTLTGTAYADTINGGGGNDVIYGGAGHDTLTGGLGVDTFSVASGLDTLTDLGQGGADVLIVAAGATAYATLHTAWTATADSVNGGAAYITTTGLTVNLAAVTTGNGFNVTNAGGATTLTGSGLDDALTGAAGADTLIGGAGHDRLLGADGKDILTGGLGTDAMDGGNDADLYLVAAILEHAAAEVTDTGSSGTDELRFTATTASTLNLFAGDTGLELVSIGTGTGATALSTGTTALNINAAAVLNGLSLVGNAGANTLTGTGYSDKIWGNAGNDVISGGAGSDVLYGGLGNDSLTGGDGQDFFVFDTTPNASTNKDTLVDFVSGVDKIQLSKTIFKALSPTESLSAADFFASSTAVKGSDASDRVVYNTTTGALYYDVDGSGSTAAIPIAVIGSTTHPQLVYSDFMFIV